MLLTRLSALFLLVYVVFALTGCVKKTSVVNEYEPPKQEEKKPVKQFTGSIYQKNMSMNLFYDTTARRIGDIITVRLMESATALSSSDTKAVKEQNVEMPPPKVAGGDVTKDEKNVLENNVAAGRDFKGSGESNKAHNFQAVITVSVVDVLPNQYLVVRGEKLLTINQSNDFIRFSGIVRPQDIDASNSVDSQKVANVRVSYSGDGELSEANKMGPLARFFQSGSYPY